MNPLTKLFRLNTLDQYREHNDVNSNQYLWAYLPPDGRATPVDARVVMLTFKDSMEGCMQYVFYNADDFEVDESLWNKVMDGVLQLQDATKMKLQLVSIDKSPN